jgi:GNAT superfamily N-acetyltransferase
VIIREAVPADIEFLTDMLVEAANWDPGREPLTRAQILAEPSLAHYVSGWQRPGDSGWIAVADGRPVGAVWLRTFPADDPGYGFVSPDIPELSAGVVASWRGKGVGRELLRKIEGTVSLSVERANAAQRLYLKEGFVVVESGRDSDTMLRR